MFNSSSKYLQTHITRGSPAFQRSAPKAPRENIIQAINVCVCVCVCVCVGGVCVWGGGGGGGDLKQ